MRPGCPPEEGDRPHRGCVRAVVLKPAALSPPRAPGMLEAAALPVVEAQVFFSCFYWVTDASYPASKLYVAVQHRGHGHRAFSSEWVDILTTHRNGQVATNHIDQC